MTILILSVVELCNRRRYMSSHSSDVVGKLLFGGSYFKTSRSAVQYRR